MEQLCAVAIRSGINAGILLAEDSIEIGMARSGIICQRGRGFLMFEKSRRIFRISFLPPPQVFIPIYPYYFRMNCNWFYKQMYIF